MHFFNLLTSTFFLLFTLVGCQRKQQSSQHAESSLVLSSDSAGSKVEADFIGVYSEGENYSKFKDCTSWEIYRIEANDDQLTSAFDSLGLNSGEAMFVRLNGSLVQTAQDSSVEILPEITIAEVIEIASYNGQHDCQLPKYKTFTFRGNEPFWSLTISSDSIIFNHFEHNEQAYPYVAPQWQDSVWVYQATHEEQKLTVRVSEDDCVGSMSGIRYNMHAELQTPLGDFEGCGGLWGRDHREREI